MSRPPTSSPTPPEPSPSLLSTADWYTRAAVELAETSELQVEWARGVAADPELLDLIGRLPREHRQPSLLFSVAGWCGAPAVAYPEWRAWVLGHWSAIEREAAQRRTQTNEVGRCIPLLLGLDRLATSHPGPIALLELGASAGLCLGVDRYSYSFDGGDVLGAGSPLLTATTSGVGVTPTRMPEVAWRAGIDLAPLDVNDAEDVRWLTALLPPDRPARRSRLRAAISTMSADPPVLVAGDALTGLASVAATAPRGPTLVVASLGTAVYLPPSDRARLLDAVAELGGHLVAVEPAAALPGILERVATLTSSDRDGDRGRDPDRNSRPGPIVLSLDGEPLANVSPHGERVSWLSPTL